MVDLGTINKYKYLAIIEWGWVGYEEFCRSRRYNIHQDLQNSSYPTKAKFNNKLLLYYSVKIFSSLKLVNRNSQPFLSLLNNTTASPGFLSQWFNKLWRQWFNNLQQVAVLTSLVQYDKILGQQQLLMVYYASGFNQTGKYFEWRIIISTLNIIISWLGKENKATGELSLTV